MAKKAAKLNPIVLILMLMFFIWAYMYVVGRHFTDQAYEERAKSDADGHPPLSDLAHPVMPGNKLYPGLPNAKK